jgi:signal transduction histidine kinase
MVGTISHTPPAIRSAAVTEETEMSDRRKKTPPSDPSPAGRSILDVRKRSPMRSALDLRGERRVRSATEATNRATDDFWAQLGHELRNSLSTIRNGIMAARLDPSRSDRALEIADRGAEQLARLVDDLPSD